MGRIFKRLAGMRVKKVGWEKWTYSAISLLQKQSRINFSDEEKRWASERSELYVSAFPLIQSNRCIRMEMSSDLADLANTLYRSFVN